MLEGKGEVGKQVEDGSICELQQSSITYSNEVVTILKPYLGSVSIDLEEIEIDHISPCSLGKLLYPTAP